MLWSPSRPISFSFPPVESIKLAQSNGLGAVLCVPWLIELQLKVYRGQKSSLNMYRVSTTNGQAVLRG